MLKISEGDVHIWFSLTKELSNSCLLAQYKDLLSEEESNQFNNFVYRTDSHRYLVSRALLRAMLSKYSSIPPHIWKFSRNVYGKPFINNEDDVLSPNKLSFNLTHTDGLVLVGLTKTADIGVDAEKISQEFDYMDIAHDNFTKNEITALESMPSIEQREFFYKHWTLKESYLKARGEGLTLPLNLFSFAFSIDNKIVCNFSDELKDCSSNWKFLQLSPVENYVSSICIRNNQNSYPQIIVRDCIPLVSETKIEDITFLSS